MDTDADEDFAAMEWSRDVLAACVWELYEALHDARDSLTTFTLNTRSEDVVLDRYSAALEGGENE
jgi:hypothetical protein